MVFLANLVFNFYSHIYITTTSLLVNVYLMQIMKKKTHIEIPVSFFFSQHWTYFGPNFAPKTTPTLLFWLNFNKICYGVQSILITYVAIQKFWKKLVKPLKNCFLDPIQICTEKRSLWTTAKMENFFFWQK